MARYENGKNAVLLEALRCAIQDREGMIDSLASGIHGFWEMSRPERMAKLSPEDREYFVEIESYLRDFEKMQKTLAK